MFCSKVTEFLSTNQKTSCTDVQANKLGTYTLYTDLNFLQIPANRLPCFSVKYTRINLLAAV